MKKIAVLAGLGDYYERNLTGYSALPFVYQNLVDLSAKLRAMGWDISPELVDPAAAKDNIIAKLKEALSQCQNPEDRLLFYYTGHANKSIVAGKAGTQSDVYCVTYHPKLRYDFLPPISEFLSEFDYASFIQEFGRKVPGGHLITILDCCYAGGIAHGMGTSPDFHTVLAASSEYTSAYYDTNSLFFSALKNSWDDPLITLEQMSVQIIDTLDSINGAQDCALTLSPKFKNQPLF